MFPRAMVILRTLSIIILKDFSIINIEYKIIYNNWKHIITEKKTYNNCALETFAFGVFLLWTIIIPTRPQIKKAPRRYSLMLQIYRFAWESQQIKNAFVLNFVFPNNLHLVSFINFSMDSAVTSIRVNV